MNIEGSIFSVECAALLEVTIIASKSNKNNIFIFSDSQSALQSLSIPKISIKTNSYILKIKKIFFELQRKNSNLKIKFFWIPAHIGIRGNENADQLAKSATEKTVLDIKPYILLIYSKTSIKLAKKTIMIISKKLVKTKANIIFQIILVNLLIAGLQIKNQTEIS